MLFKRYVPMVLLFGLSAGVAAMDDVREHYRGNSATAASEDRKPAQSEQAAQNPSDQSDRKDQQERKREGKAVSSQERTARGLMRNP